MWYVLQSLIIFVVCASNIRWHWTPNGYLAAMVEVGLAWGVTQVVADWQALRTRKRVVAKMLAHFQTHLFHVKKPKLASLVAA
jgi:hypothetical protein